MMRDDVRVAAEAAVTGGALGAAAGAARLVIFGQHGGMAAYISTWTAAIVLGVIVMLVTSHVPYDGKQIPVGVQWAMAIGFSLLAKDLMTGLRAMGEQFAIDPLALAQRVWAAIKGK